jgi:thymidylate synthase
VSSIATFGGEIEYDITERLPATTTKPTPIKWATKEMLWFLSGSTNIRPLALEKVPFWDMNAFDNYLGKNSLRENFPNYTPAWWAGLKEYVDKIKSDEVFARINGDLGPTYGAQFRRAKTIRGEVDQISELVDKLKKDPNSRRHIVNLWNIGELPEMALPPCLYCFQLDIGDEFVDIKLTQRSSDFFLAGSSNSTEYIPVVAAVANMLGKRPGRMFHSLGNVHTYCGRGERAEFYKRNLPALREKLKSASASSDRTEFLTVNDWILQNAASEKEGEEGLDHVTGAIEQLSRYPTEAPKYSLANKHILDLTIDDLRVEDYNPQKSIKRTMAV